MIFHLDLGSVHDAYKKRAPVYERSKFKGATVIISLPAAAVRRSDRRCADAPGIVRLQSF